MVQAGDPSNSTFHELVAHSHLAALFLQVVEGQGGGADAYHLHLAEHQTQVPVCSFHQPPHRGIVDLHVDMTDARMCAAVTLTPPLVLPCFACQWASSKLATAYFHRLTSCDLPCQARSCWAMLFSPLGPPALQCAPSDYRSAPLLAACGRWPAAVKQKTTGGSGFQRKPNKGTALTSHSFSWQLVHMDDFS